MLNRNLAVFIAVAEAKSVTKAAEKLHITQPAVSNAIAKLEEIFDVRLFFRDRRKESFLTPAGEETQRLALQMRRLVDQMKDVAQKEKQCLTGTLRIATITALVAPLLSPLMRRFSETYPGVRFEIIESTPSGVFESLRNHTADLALTCEPFHGFAHRVLCRDRLVALQSSSQENKIVNLFEPLERLVLNRSALETLRDFAPASQWPDFSEALLVQTAESAVQLVKDGFGTGVISEITARPYLKDLTLCAMHPDVSFDIGVVHGSEENLTAAARAFLSMLDSETKHFG